MYSCKIMPFIAAGAILATLPSSVQAKVPFTATVGHKVTQVLLESGNFGRTLSKGYTSINQTTVSCSNPSCTLGLSIMANVGDAACKSEWAIVGQVDGDDVDGG